MQIENTKAYLLALDKPPTTDLTFVRSFSSVDSDVSLKMVLPLKFARTILTFVDACLTTRSTQPVQPT